MTVNLISNYFFALFASLRFKGFYLDRTVQSDNSTNE
jgi:hypothetical protein